MLIAHGGTGGLIVELSIGLGVIAIAIAVWIANRGKTEEEMEDYYQQKIDEWTKEKE